LEPKGETVRHASAADAPSPIVYGPLEFQDPSDLDALAEVIGKAVLHYETLDAESRDGVNGPPFTLGGWCPGTPAPDDVDEGDASSARTSPALAWLEGEPPTPRSMRAAWDRSVGPRIGACAMEAMAIFSAAGFLDPAAFEEACQPDEAGRLRRSFATANPVLANIALSHHTARGLIDDGAPLRSILDALGDGDRIPLGSRHIRKASKRALANLSGTPLTTRWNHERDLIFLAADGLPRDWMPRTRVETDAFGRVCAAVHKAMGLPPRGADPVAWWRIALAGAGGRWSEYEVRTISAADPTADPSLTILSMVLDEHTESRRHFVSDVVVPVALAYGANHALGLALLPPRRHVPRHYPNKTLLDTFAHDALTSGMALPAVADMGRRHRNAMRGIKAVVDAGPVVGPGPSSKASLDSWFCLCAMPDGRRMMALSYEAGPIPSRGIGTDALVFQADDPLRSWSLAYFDDTRGHSKPPSPAETMEAVLGQWGSADALLSAMSGGRGIPALGQHPALHGRHAPYDTSAPGALEGMVAAWRPVMPRRWRRLDAAGLAAALEGEAVAYLA
jgi:hypothetical protein